MIVFLSVHAASVLGMDAQAVLGLAPDGQVASSATRLAGSSGWRGTGRSAEALWGLCAGSGKNPYRVCVDLGDRASKCSCPSRKFPCKHALALQLRDAREPLPAGDPPDWVSEWLARREKSTREVDSSPEAVERRARAREKTARNRAEAVRAGVAGLTDWLADVAGAGIAGLPARDAAWWHAIGARMVDAQAKGLASALDDLRSVVAAGGPSWAHDAADRLGGLHLLARLADTPSEVVRRRLGFSVAEEEVRAGAAWTDRWLPLLRLESDDGLVRTVRQWLWGREHGWVVAVRHAAGGARPVPALPHGVEVRGVVHPTRVLRRTGCRWARSSRARPRGAGARVVAGGVGRAGAAAAGRPVAAPAPRRVRRRAADGRPGARRGRVGVRPAGARRPGGGAGGGGDRRGAVRRLGPVERP
nr:hypothetical protein GCM10017745_05470 [Saccharothrix mutabilis subsp. capreolus]